MAEARFRLLGPVEVSLDGRPLALGAAKQRAVLAMLALSPNRVVSVDRLMEGLWGEHPPASAGKMVQLYVSQLRKLLSGADGTEIVTHGRGYELRVAADAIDAVRAERLLGEPGGARTVAELFCGPPLADLADEPFAAAEIRRLEELRRRALLRALETDVEAGRHDAALPEIEALLADEPLSERLHELRVLALYRSGRQADALAAFRAARARLVEEIGVEPGAALRGLHEAVLRQDPALSSPGLPTGTVTLVFTDIEGSTRLLRELGERYPLLLAEHQRRLRAVAAAHRGVEVNTQGDAFFFVFAGAAEPCAAAREFHAALGDGPIRVRIGIHTGEPERVGEDYTGIDVHRAARICAAGHGGQTVISERTRSLLPETATVTELGLHRLRDLGRAEKLFQLGDAAFPPLRSLNATNLPAQPSPLVGRRDDIDRIAQLVRTRRLVTLAGPGGAGKTRLALHVAAELVTEFADGVYWVPLAAVRDAALVPATIAETLGASGPPAEQIDEQRMLLVLDNLEQIVDCAPDLAGLLAACPHLRLLVTSRTVLRLAAESVYEVQPLVESEAVELFRERAAIAEPIDAVREICRRLDRLPLAIELAAARTRILPPAQLLARLEQALPVLTGGTREAPARQRTLRAAIEWSHDLLTDEQRVAFRRLAVFAGGFDLAAAEAVCGADLDLLESLLDQSLLRRTQTGRLFMLETIHEFAAQQLEQSAEAHDLRQAHAQHFLDLAERAEPAYGAYPSSETLRRLEQDQPNLRAALEWTIATAQTEAALKLCTSLTQFWITKNPVEGVRWFERALALPPTSNPRQRLRAMRSAGRLDDFANRSESALQRLRTSIALARELGDPLELAESLRLFAQAARGDPSAARPALEESLELSRQATDRAGEAFALNVLGMMLRDTGDHDASAELLERSIAISRDHGDHISALGTSHSLADLELDRGNLDRAGSLYRDSLRIAADAGDERVKLYCLAGLAAVAALDGNHDLAAQMWQAVEAGERALGFRMMSDERVRYERALEHIDTSDEPPLDLDDAVAIALNTGGS